MKDLFDTEGHLTDAAIEAVIAQTLDELGRLEVSEHLSFCDTCLVRYTAMLTDDTLLTPKEPLAAPVLQRIRRKAVTLLFNQYTTYAAAAVFALVLWGTGVFTSFVPEQSLDTYKDTQPKQSTVQKADSFLREANHALNSALAQASTILPFNQEKEKSK